MRAALALCAIGCSTVLAAPPPFVGPPIMGFLSWNAFGCGVNETKMRETADALVSTGLAARGYKRVAVDDCWAVSRDAQGNLVADPVAFPSGMGALSAYISSRGEGLSFGIYTSIGNTTCAHRPGSFDHEAQDVALFASWNVTCACSPLLRRRGPFHVSTPHAAQT